MNTVLIIISLLGGLAMFLYGMEIMGDGLKQGSGTALKNFLGKLTNNAFLGLLTGTLVTAIIQSSTATIVLTVGLIGAGILTLRQAVSIVLGANIGTTVTAQIIRLMDIETAGPSLLVFFKPSTLAPLALILGILLIMFIKKGGTKNAGMIAMGFGILFSGLLSMTAAVEPLAESEAFANALSYFGHMPVLSIFTGLVLTVIIQSSSAMVGILQALSSTGVMTFNLIYPMVMGINLGTCVTTALVCSIGSSKDAKRTGLVHIIFNIVGTLLFMLAMTVLRQAGAFPRLWNSIVDSGAIANFQTIFNLITAVVLVPFTGLLVKISCLLVKDDPMEEDKYPELAALDTKLMISPAVALDQVGRSVAAMARAAKDNIELGLEQFKEYNEARAAVLYRYEERLDNFTDNADNYLVELSRSVDDPADSRYLTMLMQTTTAIERIGDYATNFDELAADMHAAKLGFSRGAQQELDILRAAVLEILGLTVTALESGSESAARRIEPLEEVIDDMVLLLKNRHTQRLCQGVCVVNSGIIFMEMLTHLERTADQCSNIAMLVLGLTNEAVFHSHHDYIQTLHASADQSYLAEQDSRRRQYFAPLEEVPF